MRSSTSILEVSLFYRYKLTTKRRLADNSNTIYWFNTYLSQISFGMTIGPFSWTFSMKYFSVVDKSSSQSLLLVITKFLDKYLKTISSKVNSSSRTPFSLRRTRPLIIFLVYMQHDGGFCKIINIAICVWQVYRFIFTSSAIDTIDEKDNV